MKLTGKCFCGAVRIEATGSPEAMGYCHCGSCRAWSGGPVNAFSLWKPETVRVTAGAENVAMKYMARKAGFEFSRSSDWRAIRFDKRLDGLITLPQTGSRRKDPPRAGPAVA